MADSRAILAARNNADWYSMMFDMHGVDYRRSEIAFLAVDDPPPFHSWMTTLDPEAREPLRQLIDQNRHHAGFGVKDSFDCLGRPAENLHELFAASWIHADSIGTEDTGNWTRVTSAEKLSLWEAAWKDGGSPSERRQFPDAILERADVAIWGRECVDRLDDTGRFDAGVIANLSSDCVGLSNCFGKNAYPAAATLCAGMAPGLPLVGYESGDDLSAALSAGFVPTGTLRVWVSAP